MIVSRLECRSSLCLNVVIGIAWNDVSTMTETRVTRRTSNHKNFALFALSLLRKMVDVYVNTRWALLL